MTKDEKFFAWLDGELGPDEAAEMDAKVAADPDLARLAEQHRTLASQLRGAFDPIAAEAVPVRLQTAVRPSAEVIDFAARKRSRVRASIPQWTALAATLAVGVLLGTLVQNGGSAPVEMKGGRIYAAAALNQALDKELASAPAGDVRVGVTFRDQAGEICRSFTQSASSGLACRSQGRWWLKGLFAAPEGQRSSDYRMAAGMDPSLAALVDSTMAGEPFDAAAEKQARDRGWK
jgi:anti-sigma factor RsiW